MINDNSDWIILQQVYSYEEASDLEKLLLDHQILSKLVHEQASFDPATGMTSEEKLTIQIHRKDYDKARDVLFKELENQSESINEDHYLVEFTNEELLDLINHEDEWSADDVILARNILKQRNVSWNEEEVFRNNEALRDEADNPEEVSFLTLAIGYIFAFMGGLFGLLIGAYIFYSKKTNRHGIKIYNFDSESRSSAKIILLIGVSVAIVSTITYIFIISNK